jgi:outer membrane lipoprotein carrier protein
MKYTDSRKFLRVAGCLAGLLFCFLSSPASDAADAEKVAEGLERRYASVKTVRGTFRQMYRAPGIDQTESGEFWLKRPAFMRWEYRDPEEKLFVADGRESFLYVPLDRQVTVQPLGASDLRGMPLELLVGAGNIRKIYDVSSEAEFTPMTARGILMRLTPRSGEAQYSFLVLELDEATYDVRRIVIRERTGNTSEFLLTDVKTNAKIEDKKFQFIIPKGAEIIRLTRE